MSKKSIRQIIPAPKVNMGGIILNQPLPVRGLDQIDPFLLIHHGNLPAKKGAKPSEVGVGPHPHRGFSPVTFVYKGSMHHRDSIGNSELVKDGGTQWMHSGKGIVHSERPGKDQLENGGDSEFIQFWVNSPSKYKMEAPYYLPITDEGTPKIKDDKMTIAVVAGEFENIKGPAKTYSPQTLLRFEAEPGAERSINIPSNFNTLIYVLNGDIELNGQKAKSKDMVWFNNDGEEIQITVKEDSRFIVLSGEPIGEEVSTYGPFVMNTETEIREAILDYQSGKMGTLVEQF